jgi:xylulokinase
MTIEKPGWATQKPENWWNCVKKNIKEVLRKSKVNPKDIISIGTCAVMHSPVQISKNGKVIVENVQLYSDKRTSEIVENLRDRKNIDLFNNLTANIPAPNWMGMKIKWIKEHMSKEYEDTYKFISAKDYINFCLTSEICTDPSEASGTYLMMFENNAWSSELTSFLDIDMDKLPSLCPSSQIIGKITAKSSEETGLAIGTPVVCGGGDMLCSLLASGLSKSHLVVDIAATTSVLALYSSRPILDKRLMNLRHVLQGWIPYGTVDSSGGAFRWLRDVLCKEEIRVARNSQKNEYDYLTELAQKTNNGVNSILFLPYLMGERTMGSQYSKAVFFGITQDTTTEHLIRSVMEGISFEGKRILDVFEDYTHIEAVIHTAGASKSSLWSQLKANVYQKPVYTLKVSDTAVLGAALLGAIGVGVYSSEIEASESAVIRDKEFHPDINEMQRYLELYEIFKELHDSLQVIFYKHSKNITAKAPTISSAEFSPHYRS